MILYIVMSQREDAPENEAMKKVPNFVIRKSFNNQVAAQKIFYKFKTQTDVRTQK